MKKKLINFILILLFLFLTSSCLPKDNKRGEIILSDNRIGILTLYSYDGKDDSKYGLMNLGHSFLSFINESEFPVKIGEYEVKQNETITFGTWAISTHFGIWYNLESLYINDFSKYQKRVSIRKSIDTVSEISMINAFMLKNDRWNPYYNCTSFALRLWNELANENEVIRKGIIYSPLNLSNEIRRFENYSTGEEVAFNDNIGFFNGANFIKNEVANA